MKRISVLTVCLVVLLAAGSASAIDRTPAPKAHSFEIGPALYYHNYEEPGLMENEGYFYGVTGAYMYARRYSAFRLEGLAAWGQVDYESPFSGTIDDIDDTQYEVRALVGPYLPMSLDKRLFAYAGFAYRYLEDDSSGEVSSLGDLGYNRQSNYYYTPIGVRYTTQPKSGWTIGFSLEYDYFWEGRQKSFLSDTGLGQDDIENKQNEGYGARGSLRFGRKWGDVQVVVEPFVNYWDIEDSEVEDSWIEPANNTVEYGVNLIFGF